ncbi:LHFPL tetraspan subfamily member 6 protein-like [Centruroides vittatus]|uniref:LHFPL tetraspan subfamily member 6 protein-like n=1 Tax=Centruroides sculpturatus TaxID=218467 RepID=UPI000C6DFF78|nr:LHFPL tetraspan subfamily member 6 protein-like [Centruroides sculpturatus]
MPPMATSLTATGVVWSSLSLASAILNCAGFYLPLWIRGQLPDGTEVTFGSFRRCNYPRFSETGKLDMVHECGRYTTFADIPSLSWQISTITVGLGASVSLLVTFTSLAACCVSDVITKYTARVLGVVQLMAALLMGVGCSIYPNGWSSPEVKDACGNQSDAYRLGTCEVNWSIYLMSTGIAFLLFCSVLSLKASRIKPNSYRI